MKKIKAHLLLITVALISISCLRPYTMVNQKNFKAKSVVETINMDEFEIFTFNICESYKDEIDGAERFIKCPNNFFDISAKDKIKKVEELYLLKKKNSNLVIYATSYSHKYIGKQKGFLNDRENYENKFYLKQTEFIYIGRLDATQKVISFHLQKRNDVPMIWHLSSPLNNADSLNIEKVNIETVENTGSYLDKPIDIIEVFNLPLTFYRSNYALKDYIEGSQVSKLYVVARDEKKELIFETDSLSKRYRFPARLVKYYTNK